MLSRIASIGVLLALSAAPALAANTPDGNSTPVQPPFGAGSPSPSPCVKAKRQLTPEQRERRQAMRAQRAAQRAAQGITPRSSPPRPNRQPC